MTTRSVKTRVRLRLAGAGLVMALLAGCSASTATPGAKADKDQVATAVLTVTTAPVITMAATDRVVATGTVTAWQEIAIGSQASGLPIVEVLIDEGDHVEAGGLVARLDDAMIVVEIARQEAAVREAEAAVEDAAAARERAHTLLGRQSVSKETAELAATAEKATEARLAQAKAALDALEVQRDRTRITAPVSGTVSAPPATVGTVVQNGTEIMRLVRDGRLEVWAKVPEQNLARIAAGSEAIATDAAGDIVEATVRGIAERVDAANRLGTVYVTLPEGSGLRPGMFARVTIATATREVASVPQAAIVWRDGKSYAFVLRDDRSVEMRSVQIGPRQDDAIAVTEGLVVGESVVTAGGGFLNDGNIVRVAGVDSPRRSGGEDM